MLYWSPGIFTFWAIKKIPIIFIHLLISKATRKYHRLTHSVHCPQMMINWLHMAAFVRLKYPFFCRFCCFLFSNWIAINRLINSGIASPRSIGSCGPAGVHSLCVYHDSHHDDLQTTTCFKSYDTAWKSRPWRPCPFLMVQVRQVTKCATKIIIIGSPGGGGGGSSARVILTSQMKRKQEAVAYK